MLLLILYWALLIPLFLGWGMCVYSIISSLSIKQNTTTTTSFFLLVLLGMATVSLVAGLLSFVLPLGQGPYILIVLYVFALGFIYMKRQITADAINNIEIYKGNGIVFLAVFLIVLFKSASPSELLDEGGYYLPFIKWVETYGITPGLANLQGRFGFNSSWHILSALVSLRWSGVLFYDLNGFVILIIIGYHLLGTPKNVSPMRYVAGLFVSAFIFRNFLTSSSADLPNIYLSSLVILLLIDKYENKTLAEIDYTFIVAFILSIFLVTIKASSIYLLLIYLPTVVCAFNNKQFNTIIWLIGIALLFVIPWCIRFYITTGYLVFPMPGIDFFNPNWKVPYQYVLDERNAVKCFPISDTLPMKDVLQMSFMEWFPSWFEKSLFEQKAFFSAIILVTLYHVFNIKKYLHSLNDRLFICIQLSILLNILIWLTQYPDFRFAWGYILIYVFVGVYYMANEWSFMKSKIPAFALVFLIFMTSIHMIKTLKDVSRIYKTILIKQAPFPKGERTIVRINHVSYYKSDTAWDIPLPSVLGWQHPNIVLRDLSLKGGFKPKE